MGNNQSMISTESAVTLLAIAGAIGLGYTQFGPASNSKDLIPTTELREQSSSKKAKKKKAKKASAEKQEVGGDPTTISAIPSVVPFPEVIPGALDTEPSPLTQQPPEALKSKKKKKTKPAKPLESAAEDSSIEPALPGRPKKARQRNQESSPSQDPMHGSMSIETDGSWTRVAPGRRSRRDAPSEATTSDAGVTTSVTGTSSPVAERTEEEDLPSVSRPASNRRPLAERLLPKPRKTGVEDLLETPDVPPVARVMRLQPRPGEKPAQGFSWGDYEDVEVGDTTGGENDADGEDDGWGVVPTRRRTKLVRATSGTELSTSASETMTKKKRQNAKRREAEKAAKADAEKVRQANLAQRQRALEKERMMEQLKRSGGSKTQSGGMKAAVDDRG